MFKAKAVNSSFSVNDIPKAKKFYKELLGLDVKEEDEMGLRINLPKGGSVFVYPKENHEPATFTIMNFIVDNIDEAVEELERLGITFERYEGFNQDEKGIARGKSADQGPDVAWFKDPAGNILAVLEV